MPLPRIIGGTVVSPELYPWVVSLELKSKHYCGGVLIHDNFIATAAHCTTGISDQWRAVIKTENNGYVKFKIRSRHIHPKFNSSSYYYDVAIWETDFDIREVMKPFKIYLDTGNSTDSDEILGITVGWGVSNLKKKRRKYRPVLRQVEIPIIPTSECKKIKAYNDLDEESQFCAGYPEGGFDACFGDSGGPIFRWYKKVPLLLGLVSSGEGCAFSGYPGIYSKALVIPEFLLSLIKD